MSNLELGFSPNEDRSFQSSIEYEDPSVDPVNVARTTSNVLDKTFLGTGEPWELRFLANDTLNLVYAARRGYLGNLKMMEGVRIDPKRLSTILEINEQFSGKSPSDEDTEAFARFYLAFGIMPELAQHVLLPNGFSRSGNLAPPSNNEESLERINEVGSQIKQVVGGEISSHEKLVGKPSLLRTYWAFKAIAYMPERTLESDSIDGIRQETLEALADKFANPENR